ncbi:water-soluble carotenoid protein [Stanieria cyanosphaera PCC 7437]|uniref:Water-soluble carotenoid protein n=1 Tax=Stanieria cyanosphaera (strain ATCC 29371 / PCC 7437) TaxID=111780 RepID=K9XYK2_STAC7|nr:hypothetical protein [Stanieria cyanosphaera]AFZ37104.1 water-soluble carotenoid protein [Stanieria cyanosphaera PCC 7437]
MINSSLQIAGITNPTILDYFNTINQEEFIETANLFNENGVLYAPFESPLEGKQAIASYLEKEAKDMKLEPKQGISENLADNLELIKVTGKVHTSLFSVNVRWEFTINSSQQLEAVKIKLLASPQELLKLNVKAN